MKLSIVVPIFNEEASISWLHQEILDMCRDPKGCSVPFDWEIIFVDDGSQDLTRQICRTLHPLRYIGFDRNYGQTAAMDCGFREAKGDYIAALDADGQNDPRDIPAMLQYLIDHDLDVVSGWRKRRQDDVQKKVESRMANVLRQKMLHDGVHDSGCTLKIYRKECFDNLRLYGGQHRFIPAILKSRGYKVGEMRVNHRPRKKGESKYNHKRIINGLRDICELRIEYGHKDGQPPRRGPIRESIVQRYYKQFEKTPYRIAVTFENHEK